MALSKEKKTKIPKKASKGDLPKTEKEWIAYVNNAHHAGLQNRRKFEFQWILNYAYYLGYQDLKYDRSRGTIRVPKTIERPITVNRIGAFVDARKAKLTQNRPIPKVVPNSVDKDDINGAKFAGHALDHLWRRTDQEEEYEKVVTLELINGTAFKKTIWDPFSGEYVKQAKKTKNDEIVVSDEGEIEEEKIFMGEVSSRALSAFNIIPADDSIEEVKDQPWMIERSWIPISEVEKMMPHLKGKIKSNFDEKTDYENILDRLSTPVATGLGSAIMNISDSINSDVLVKTMWIKPNSEYEEGVVIVVVNNLLGLIDVFPNDYGTNIYPYVKFTERTDGYHFWGQATIERLLGIQRSYNRLRQKKLNNAFLMANGKWMNPKGSQLIEGALTDLEAEVVEYNPAVPEPHQAAIAPLPQYVTELPRELIVDFRDTGGQSETSFSPNPNLTAGVAIQVSAEVQDQMIAPILKRLARSMAKVANQQLILMNEEYIEDRKIMIFGEGNAIGAQWMSAVDFRNHADVHIEVESMFPDFRGAKQQRLIDLWDRRIIQDPRMFLEAFRFGNFDKIVEDLEKEEDPVIIDIEKIKNGETPEVTQYQNHQAYFKKLSDWINTPEFLRLIPQRKQLALDVLQAHMQFLMQSLPGQGAPVTEQNQNSVGSEFGSINPAGQPGNQAF